MRETKNGTKTLFARMIEKSIERDGDKSVSETKLAKMTEWLRQRLVSRDTD